jgi:hypothetical protein
MTKESERKENERKESIRREREWKVRGFCGCLVQEKVKGKKAKNKRKDICILYIMTKITLTIFFDFFIVFN